jgi:hypothetical protein
VTFFLKGGEGEVRGRREEREEKKRGKKEEEKKGRTRREERKGNEGERERRNRRWKRKRMREKRGVMVERRIVFEVQVLSVTFFGSSIYNLECPSTGKKDRDDESSGIEILMTDVFVKINPTDPARLTKQVARRKRN